MNSADLAEPVPAILVVDDDLYLLAAIKQTLMLNGFAVQTYASPIQALASLGDHSFAAVLADIRMPEMNGMVLLERIVAQDPDLPVIMITGHGDIGLAVEAVKKGAYDFLQKPVDEEIILTTLGRALERRRLVLENRRLERQLEDNRQQRSRFAGLVGGHPSMRALYRLIETIAQQTDPVLIVGETGTGKELVARAVHEFGRHRQAPYVAVNMAALPAEMIESELFGHEKGAFTGAVQRKVGKFEYAGEGTLFLDEICSMPASLQAKLLRVLEERSFNRLGGNAAIPLKARIIAASNRDLEQEIERGAFRQDLFYRLNVLPVRLPALRERREDIPLLVDHFWREICDDQAGGVKPCPAEFIRQLEGRDWPGNIRELRNTVRRFCVLGDAGTTTQPATNEERGGGEVRPWREHMEAEERRYLEQVLGLAGGQVNLACSWMGLSRKSLYEKINKHGIELTRFRERSNATVPG